MASDYKYITISSLTGGFNDYDPPLTLPEDTCTVAENIEYFYSSLGERRLGCVGINLHAGIGSNTNLQATTWLSRFLPTNDQGDAELWMLAQNLSNSTYNFYRRTKAAWLDMNSSFVLDTPTTTSGYGHKTNSVSLHGKLFLAFKSSNNRDSLHVWDGTRIRRVSMSAPAAAPTGANTGGGTFASTRYYRVRFTVLTGSTVNLRSEPSSVLTFAPSGAGTGVIVTRPTVDDEALATHWELEASTDNANFYMIVRTPIGTTTTTDSTAFAVGYSSGTLSEDLTSYTTVPSGKYLTVDSDRLLIAGSYENPAYASRLWWTPVLGNTGVGNDERLDMTINPYLDLDGYEGGEITALSRSINGYIYVFKFSHIYKVIRTGQRSAAYSAIPITKSRGAFPGSLVEAVDEAGRPAQYFLDPKIGPMRIGTNGPEWCGSDVRIFWNRVNQSALVPAHGVFYQAKNQVHFWVAVDGSNYPNAKIILHCDEVRVPYMYATANAQRGGHRGWTTVPVGDRIAAAHCSVMFSNNVDSADSRNQILVPFIGLKQWTATVGGVSTTIQNLVQQCDTGATDGLIGVDNDAYYYGKIVTKPFSPVGVMNKCGVSSAVIIAKSQEGANNSLYIQGIKDFGPAAVTTNVVFTSSADKESIVIKELDEFSFSEAKTVQIAFGDLDTTILPTASWRLYSFGMKVRMEQTSS